MVLALSSQIFNKALDVLLSMSVTIAVLAMLPFKKSMCKEKLKTLSGEYKFKDIKFHYADDDKIAVMRDGVCVEIGTYKELMKKKGEFYIYKTMQS